MTDKQNAGSAAPISLPGVHPNGMNCSDMTDTRQDTLIEQAIRRMEQKIAAALARRDRERATARVMAKVGP